MQSPLNNWYDWPLFKEVNKNNNLNYDVSRCLEPTAVVTQGPWFPRDNNCPCDPKLSNITGRGFTSCPIGVSELIPTLLENERDPNMIGSLFSQKQYSPTQYNPYPNIRIGESWRSVS